MEIALLVEEMLDRLRPTSARLQLQSIPDNGQFVVGVGCEGDR
jgi:hypothetical protein